ncbi:serine/threonine protein kinase [Streptomyces bambusae]|uniref:serine/threonine-protein kinase n=1 Tax=Streptomyces bambusae TaxID=1550616 RepID=UPI001CFFCA28|nr:serine/threonine-protein kinase [Streptomyces bambusae]MCB5169708.1 serine/threonine protein kinase [Streptomyces bambusae]
MEALRPGDPAEIGGYRLLARLGEGGMGEVFLARTASGRALALKTVHRELSREDGFAERFAQEIRTSDRVRSPWTVSVVDFGPPTAAPQWLATEYVAAPSLADWVHRRGPLAEPAVRSLARELAAALVAVRAVGVVHRDIKPANVLLGPERPFLIDFGIARAVREPRRTRTGTVIGTPGYLAPEQATGAPVGAPADVFSLAAVLVYAATGRGPFLGPGEEVTLPALLYRVVHDEPVLDGVPAALVPLVRDCLAKDPAARPAAEELPGRLGTAAADWAAAAPAELVADTGRRAAELGALLAGRERAVPAAPVPSAAADPAQALPAHRHIPTAPGTPPAPATIPARPERRPSVTAAAAVGAAVVATAVTLLIALPNGDDDPKDNPTGTRTGTGTKSSAPAVPPPDGTLPASWIGTWSGTGPGTPDADGVTQARTGKFAVTVTLNAGTEGDLIGRQVSDVTDTATGRNLGCTDALELRQFHGDRAVFKAVTTHPTDRSAQGLSCREGNLYVVTKTGPDRLTIEVEGAQSAGAPDTLTRRR